MNNLPREKLILIIKENGTYIINNPQLCKGFLLDYCGEYRGEIKILIDAINEGIVKELLNISQGIPKETILARLKNKLVALNFQEEAAQWTVESWALALGVISESEINNNTEKKLSTDSDSPPESKSPPLGDIDLILGETQSLPNTPVSSQPNLSSSTISNQDNNTIDSADLKALKKAEKQIKTCYIMGMIASLSLFILLFPSDEEGGIILALLTGISSVIFGLNYRLSVVIDVIILLITLFFLINKKSRISAWILFIYFIISKLLLIIVFINNEILSGLGTFYFIITSIVWGVAYWRGIQGTFAYHRLKNKR